MEAGAMLSMYFASDGLALFGEILSVGTQIADAVLDAFDVVCKCIPAHRRSDVNCSSPGCPWWRKMPIALLMWYRTHHGI